MSPIRSISHRFASFFLSFFLFFIWYYCSRNGLHNSCRVFCTFRIAKFVFLHRVFLIRTLQNLVFPLLQESCCFTAKLQAPQDELEALPGSAATTSSFISCLYLLDRRPAMLLASDLNQSLFSTGVHSLGKERIIIKIVFLKGVYTWPFHMCSVAD